MSGCKKFTKVLYDYSLTQLDEYDAKIPVQLKHFSPTEFFDELEKQVGEYDIKSVYLSNYLSDSSKGSFNVRWRKGDTFDTLYLESMYFEFSIRYSGSSVHIYSCQYFADDGIIRVEKAREEESDDSEALVRTMLLNEILGSFMNINWVTVGNHKDFPIEEDYYYVSIVADDAANIVTTSTTFEEVVAFESASAAYALNSSNTLTELNFTDLEAKFPRKSFVFPVKSQSKSGNAFITQDEVVVCPEVVSAKN